MQTTVASAPHVRRLGVVITAFGLAMIAMATLFPDSAAPATPHLCIMCGSRGGADAVLNVLLFVPLGVGLALLNVPTLLAITSMLCLSAAIETAQFFVIAGRDATVSDLLANGLGGALGFAIGRHLFTILRPRSRVALGLLITWSILWLLIQALSAYGISRAAPESEYFGQIARRLGNYALFRGRVVSAAIGNVSIVDRRFESANKVRQELLDGALISSVIVPAEATDGVAPIVRVVDEKHREILLVAQRDNDLVFRQFTGAAMLRLQPLTFAARGVFHSRSGDGFVATPDTVTIGATYSAREVSLSVKTFRVTSDRRIRVTPAVAWTMLMPFEWTIEGSQIDAALNALWVCCLLLPLGYWATFAARSTRWGLINLRLLVPWSIVGGCVLVGLAIVPRLLEAGSASGADWLAGGIGLLLGVALARTARA